MVLATGGWSVKSKLFKQFERWTNDEHWLVFM